MVCARLQVGAWAEHLYLVYAFIGEAPKLHPPCQANFTHTYSSLVKAPPTCSLPLPLRINPDVDNGKV